MPAPARTMEFQVLAGAPEVQSRWESPSLEANHDLSVRNKKFASISSSCSSFSYPEPPRLLTSRSAKWHFPRALISEVHVASARAHVRYSN